MKFEFDPDKDAANRAKHGISLARAAELDWNRMLVKVDARKAYGEVRYEGIAPLGARLYVLIYSERREAIRPISLRKANRREVKRHAAQIEV